MTHQLSLLLTTHNLRTTRARIAVFTALHDAHQPLTIQAITALCTGIDRSSVYRVLAVFLDIRIIQTVHKGWKVYYELSDQFKPHHHHFICDICGRIIDITSQQLENSIEKIASDKQIHLTSHHIELRGVCNACHMPKMADGTLVDL